MINDRYPEFERFSVNGHAFVFDRMAAIVLPDAHGFPPRVVPADAAAKMIDAPASGRAGCTTLGALRAWSAVAAHVPCEACKNTGRAQKQVECKCCNGTGSIECDNPICESGHDCDACDGDGIVVKDQTCPACDGDAEIKSERYLSHVAGFAINLRRLSILLSILTAPDDQAVAVGESNGLVWISGDGWHMVFGRYWSEVTSTVAALELQP